MIIPCTDNAHADCGLQLQDPTYLPLLRRKYTFSQHFHHLERCCGIHQQPTREGEAPPARAVTLPLSAEQQQDTSSRDGGSLAVAGGEDAPAEGWGDRIRWQLIRLMGRLDGSKKGEGHN